jgi:surface protein
MNMNNNTIRESIAVYKRDIVDSERIYGPISTWDASGVTDMSKLFINMREFDEDVSSWQTQNVTNMSCMFNGAALFNGDLSS